MKQFIILSIFFSFLFGKNIEKADLIIVHKSLATLSLMKNDKVLAKYDVAFGEYPKGHKHTEGDEKTPEGNYTLDYKNSKSKYYKSIHISYPNKEDKEYAKKRGIPTGGDIMLHGQKNNFGWFSFLVQKFNWTNGCIALTNQDMDDVWMYVDVNTSIIIYP